jgi:hypothetical protein
VIEMLHRRQGCNHRGDHEGNRLAAPLSPRLLFAGVVRSKLGLTLVSEKPGEQRVYRIVAKAPHRRNAKARRSQGGVTGMARRSSDRGAIEAEIDRVRSLIDELRSLWRTTLRSSPPPALTKDLWRGSSAGTSRSEALGGLIRTSQSFSTASPEATGRERIRSRRLKPGTVLVREYQGERHTSP